jgi:ring-1,2-phenylacetyl-CoA epoxidase subunit PaaC
MAGGYGVNNERLKPIFDATVNAVLAEATLQKPKNEFMQKGGKDGYHTEYLGYLLAEMQYLQRAYPNSVW